MKNAISFFALATLLSAAALTAVAQGGRNSVSGFVFDDRRMPVANINVELLSDYYSTVARARTGGSGTFSFRGLPDGRYVIRVLASGTDYEEQSRSISLIAVSAIPGSGSVAEYVDFYLRKKASSAKLGAPAVIFVQDVPARAKEFYEAGLADLEAKKDKEAFEKIKRAIELFPDYYYALDRLGNEYLTRGYFEAAYLLLAKSATVNPRSITSVLGLGVSLYRLGDVDKAFAQFQNAVSLDKNSAFAHLWVGIVLQNKGKPQESLASLIKANELSNGSSPEVHFQLARVYKDLNQFGKAADSLEQYLKHRPNADNAQEVRKAIASLRNKGE